MLCPTQIASLFSAHCSRSFLSMVICNVCPRISFTFAFYEYAMLICVTFIFNVSIIFFVSESSRKRRLNVGEKTVDFLLHNSIQMNESTKQPINQQTSERYNDAEYKKSLQPVRCTNQCYVFLFLLLLSCLILSFCMLMCVAEKENGKKWEREKTEQSQNLRYNYSKYFEQIRQLNAMFARNYIFYFESLIIDEHVLQTR